MPGDADFSYRKVLCDFEGPTDAKGVPILVNSFVVTIGGGA